MAVSLSVVVPILRHDRPPCGPEGRLPPDDERQTRKRTRPTQKSRPAPGRRITAAVLVDRVHVQVLATVQGDRAEIDLGVPIHRRDLTYGVDLGRTTFIPGFRVFLLQRMAFGLSPPPPSTVTQRDSRLPGTAQ